MATNRKSTLKPAGWLAVVVLAVLGIGLIGLLVRPLTEPIRTLPEVGAVGTLNPTITPYVKPSVTPVPSATPLPGGWTQEKGLNGQLVFVPPAETQKQILEVLNAVVACGHVEDAPDKVLLALPNKQTACDTAKGLSAWAVSQPQHRVMTNSREINKFGPVNPIQCADFKTCTVARAKLDLLGFISNEIDVCQSLLKKETAPCIYRGKLANSKPYQMFILTIVKQGDGTWKANTWTSEELPGPPPSPSG